MKMWYFQINSHISEIGFNFTHNFIYALLVLYNTTLIELYLYNFSFSVEVYDFLSRTWKFFETESVRDQVAIQSKPHSARLINHDSLVELDLQDPSLELASLPPNVEGGATFHYGDTLCLAGGFNTETKLLRKDVVCWNRLSPDNSSTSNWVPIPPMTNARYKAAAVVLNGKLFVTGGYDTNAHEFMDSVEVFDDVLQKWYPVSPLLNGGRAGHKVEVYTEKV